MSIIFIKATTLWVGSYRQLQRKQCFPEWCPSLFRWLLHTGAEQSVQRISWALKTKKKQKLQKNYYMVKYIKTFLARLRCSSRQLKNFFFQNVQKKHIFDLLRSFLQFHLSKKNFIFCSATFCFRCFKLYLKIFFIKTIEYLIRKILKKLKHVKIRKK